MLLSSQFREGGFSAWSILEPGFWILDSWPDRPLLKLYYFFGRLQLLALNSFILLSWSWWDNPAGPRKMKVRWKKEDWRELWVASYVAVVGGKGFCLVIAVSQKALRDMRTDKERSTNQAASMKWVQLSGRTWNGRWLVDCHSFNGEGCVHALDRHKQLFERKSIGPRRER